MSWNYRVIRYIDGNGTMYGYSIAEVYYKNGKIDCWSEAEVYPWGESLAELRRDLAHMRKALTLPVLEERKGKLVEVKE